MDDVDADIVCLQETKAQEHQLPLEAAIVGRYHGHFFDAERKGYSGVAIYTKREPDRVIRGFGWPDFDADARYIQLDFSGLSVASLYVVSGAMGPARQVVKEAFLKRLYEFLGELKQSGRSFIVAGDYNIAHKEIDVYNPVRCSKISGFFPHERAWMDDVLTKIGWADSFRVVNQEPKQFTWWSNFQQAFERNNGWRIDYQLATPDIAPFVRSASIYRTERFSDHAPVTIEYDLSL